MTEPTASQQIVRTQTPFSKGSLATSIPSPIEALPTNQITAFLQYLSCLATLLLKSLPLLCLATHRNLPFFRRRGAHALGQVTPIDSGQSVSVSITTAPQHHSFEVESRYVTHLAFPIMFFPPFFCSIWSIAPSSPDGITGERNVGSAHTTRPTAENRPFLTLRISSYLDWPRSHRFHSQDGPSGHIPSCA